MMRKDIASKKTDMKCLSLSKRRLSALLRRGMLVSCCEKRSNWVHTKLPIHHVGRARLMPPKVSDFNQMPLTALKKARFESLTRKERASAAMAPASTACMHCTRPDLRPRMLRKDLLNRTCWASEGEGAAERCPADENVANDPAWPRSARLFHACSLTL